MTAPVDIANMALARLAVPSIATFGDNSPAARVCNRLFTTVSNGLLAARDWRFATARAALVPSPNPALFPWSFAYIRPAACLKPRFVTVEAAGEFGMGNDDRVPFEPGMDVTNPSTPFSIISANASPAYLIFTAFVSDPTLWEAGFVECVSLQIAAEACFPLTGNGQLAMSLRQAASDAVNAIEMAGQSQGVSGMQRGSERQAVR